MYRVGPKSKLLHFVHIFAKYRSIFTIFSPVNSARNLLLSGMHTTLTMLLHYLVKYKYPETQYLEMDRRSNGKFFKVFKLNVTK